MNLVEVSAFTVGGRVDLIQGVFKRGEVVEPVGLGVGVGKVGEVNLTNRFDPDEAQAGQQMDPARSDSRGLPIAQGGSLRSVADCVEISFVEQEHIVVPESL